MEQKMGHSREQLGASVRKQGVHELRRLRQRRVVIRPAKSTTEHEGEPAQGPTWTGEAPQGHDNKGGAGARVKIILEWQEPTTTMCQNAATGMPERPSE